MVALPMWSWQSASACHRHPAWSGSKSSKTSLERVKKLEDEGFIRGYHARLNPSKLQAGLLVFVEIRLVRTSHDVFEAFKQAVVSLPQVLECHLVSGDFDYLIKARVADMVAYRELLGTTLLTLPGVAGSRSYAVMEEVKETLELPVRE